MAYANWDASSSAAYNRLLAYTRHIAGTAGYSTSTFPTLAETEAFLDDAYIEMAGLLESYGYGTATTDVDAQRFLQNMQAITAAVRIELTTPTTMADDAGSKRYEALEATRKRLEDLVKTDGLARMGMSKAEAKGAFVFAGGVSRDRKKAVDDDTDLVRARFRRGWGQAPAVVEQRAEVDEYL